MFPRLFAGIALDAHVREAGVDACQALERTAFNARYEEVASGTSSFAITLDKLSSFPNERRPRVIYLGSREGNPAFRSLCARLRSRYIALGFARVKGGSLRPLPQIDVQPTSMHVREITLFESITEARKTRYEVLRTALLSP